MREVNSFLHKESAKLYQLLRDVQDNRNTQERVWDDFCRKTSDEPKTKRIYFKKHPKHLSSSSSETFSPRESAPPKAAKPSKSPKLQHWRSEISSDEHRKSQSSLDIVTVRQELDIVRSEYPGKAYGKVWGGGERREADVKRVKYGTKSVEEPRRSVQKDAPIGTRKLAAKKQSLEKAEKPRDVITEANIETKLSHVLDKTLKCMEDIRMQIDAGIVLPDGDDDLDRRRKRSVEFASRFSRNYLYQLNRQVNDIIQSTHHLNGNITGRTACSVRQKLVASYQTLLQGLQAYYIHLPVSTTNAVPDKVRELLKLTSSLCEIHRTCASKDLNSNLEQDNIIDVFEVRSRCLLEKLNERYFCPSSPSLMQINSNTADFYQLRSDNRRRPNKKKNNTAKNRYAMYSMTPVRNDEAWKKACALLAKKKFNVPSKYKTANFKHRPPVDKQMPLQKQVPKGNKVVEKKSSDRIKPKSVLNDDNIQTIVQWHTDKGSDACLNTYGEPPKNAVNIGSGAQQQLADDKRDALANLIGQVVNAIAEDNKEVNQHQVRNILQGFLDYVGAAQEAGKDRRERAQTEKRAPEEDQKDNKDGKEPRWSGVEHFDATLLEKVVDALTRNQESLKKAKEACEQSATKDEAQEKKKPERKKSITVTGVKNAQLICIKDEDSAVEPSSDDEPKPRQEPKKKGPGHSGDGTDQTKNSPNKPSEAQVQKNCTDRVSKIKISRLPRGPLRPLKMLPKKCALDILEYKINYVKARKGNHMYKKSATKQPWVLMGEIADKILDELIQGVGSEIQVNGVIDSIYASEFAQ